jgi:hypothetical protein
LLSALIVSVPLYMAPTVLPAMLFWFATLVEIVPAAWAELKKMAALPAVAPFPVKQFPVTLLFCAPRSAPALPRFVSAMPEEALLLNKFPETWTCWMPAWMPFAA